MDRWENKVAVVTGASSGIGAAVAEDLLKAGLVVAALDRREARLWQNQSKLPSDLQASYHPLKCDVTVEDEVQRVFEWIEKNLGGTDILIANAGIYRNVELITPNNTKDILDTLNTNVMGIVYCVREAFSSMKKRDIDGHVVIMSSVSGHRVPIVPGHNMNIYPATKHAVTAMTETYRQEFAKAATKVKITCISPGLVETELIPREEFEAFKEAGISLLKLEDISNTILYVLGTPPHVQVHEVIIQSV